MIGYKVIRDDMYSIWGRPSDLNKYTHIFFPTSTYKWRIGVKNIHETYAAIDFKEALKWAIAAIDENWKELPILKIFRVEYEGEVIHSNQIKCSEITLIEEIKIPELENPPKDHDSYRELLENIYNAVD